MVVSFVHILAMAMHAENVSDQAEPRLASVQCLHPGGLHRMAYWEWGDPTNPDVLVCVHGLTRQGRDFDALARALCGRFRVVCPDVAGRGRSAWLAQPMHYQLAQYVGDMVTLLARLDARRLGWVGTSMGGLIGIGLAGMRDAPVHALVLNDIGPSLDAEGVRRIGSYVGQPRRFDSVEQGAAYLASIGASFGPHTPEQWLTLSRPMFVPEGDGWRLHYDPSIAIPFSLTTPEAAAAGEAMLWSLYDAIAAPTLVLRGADSDLLSRGVAEAMRTRGPGAKLVEFAGVGHAPTLVQAEQIAAVREFLDRAMPTA